MPLDGTHLNLFISFVAGIVTFFASCLLPLVPIYLAYLSGVALTTKKHKEKWEIFRTALFFVLGFIFIFVLMGATLNTFYRAISPYKKIIDKFSGLLFVVLGLYLIEIIHPSFLTQEHKLHTHKFKKHKLFHAFLTGITFGFAWTPCIGPVLGVILLWASRQTTHWQGIKLLIFYGLGIGVPFLLTGFLFEYIHPFLHKNARLSIVFQKIAGLVILFAGILLMLNKLQYFSLWLLSLLKISPYSG